MRSDKLYKFCDGTLTSVRRDLHDIAFSLRMDYLPKRRWSKLDRKRSRIMIKVIDQQLFERRLMRNLEKFVGGRDYGNDSGCLNRQYDSLISYPTQFQINFSLDRSMDSDKYLEGQSMQRPPLFESDSFIYWKNRFETYVKSKDLDLWHVITNGDFQPIQQNPKTKLDEVIPFEKQSDDLKKKLAKNNEAKMVIYNALPRKEYERIFMCNTAKEIWKTLLITHQGNNQVKDNKIDLLVQQYEQFVISEDETIDSAFARFNTIITSLKALDKGYSSKNYVRTFLRALHPKRRAKVTAIEESKDLTSVTPPNRSQRNMIFRGHYFIDQ
ncbi:hypothetical protein Tco_0733011 [Tanacetum coccineum]